MLRVGEVEQASVVRLNNCINIGGSPRTPAYTAEGGRGVYHYTAAFSHFQCSAPIFFFLLPLPLSFVFQLSFSILCAL